MNATGALAGMEGLVEIVYIRTVARAYMGTPETTVRQV